MVITLLTLCAWMYNMTLRNDRYGILRITGCARVSNDVLYAQSSKEVFSYSNH